MQSSELDLVLGTMPEDRLPFPYYRGRFAAQLLAYVSGDQVPVHELRGSPFARLLQQGPVKALLQRCGSGVVRGPDLLAHWPVRPTWFRLTLGRWGADMPQTWSQNSRPGETLVVRVNFDSEHDRRFAKLLGPEARGRFARSGHPIENANGLTTLAWARIDIDLESGEALIEEIQNDWVRAVLWQRHKALRYREQIASSDGSQSMLPTTAALIHRLLRYYDEVLAPRAAYWSELTMAAALHVLVEQIGIRRIWCHTPESGVRWKRIEGDAPPRSLYTQLPRKFCFRHRDALPSFLDRERSDVTARAKRRKGARKSRWLEHARSLGVSLQELVL